MLNRVTRLLQLIGAAAGLLLVGRADGQSSFTVVAIPDTQFYSESALGPGANFFDIQTQWILSNTSTHGIVFASHLGDVVNHAGAVGVPLLDQWDDAVRAMGLLRASALPFGILPGNHDWTSTAGNGSLEHYRVRFGDTSDFFTGKPWFLGYDARGVNSAQIFNSPIGQILHLALEWNFSSPAASSDRPGAPGNAIGWAQTMINAHPGMPTIIATHNNINAASTRDGAGNGLFNALVRTNNQIFLVLNGHYHGEGRVYSINDFGRAVYELNSDYQSRNRGGDGWLRLYRFEPANQRIRVRTYTPLADAVDGVPAGSEFGFVGRVETDANSQFDLPLDFGTRFVPPVAAPSRGPAPAPATRYTLKRLLNGYSDVEDTEIRLSNPAANLSTQGYMHLDTDDDAGGTAPGPSCGLVRFGNLFGGGPNQLSNDRDMLAATLRLYVHPQRSNSEGSGFEVRRMLVPWSGSSTWNSMTMPGTSAGSPPGIADDGSSGFEALANPDGSAGGDSGIGVTAGQWLEFDVRRTLLSWRAGQPNLGWLLQPFPNGTNGVRIESSESELAGRFFPELVITPARGLAHLRTFSDGIDTQLDQSDPNTQFSTAGTIIVDASVENNTDPLQSDVQGLLRFGGLFGDQPTQIPAGARISSAVLTLNINPIIQFHDGTGFGIHRMLRDWISTETWNTAGPGGGGISADNIEALALSDDAGGLDRLGASVVQSGPYHLDVTESLRAWSITGEATNFGWAILPFTQATNGIFFDSFEASHTGAIRPRLTVRFICPADVNADGLLGVQDIFNFLADYFGSDLAADINASGTLTVQDIFDFLDRYFTGC